MIPTVADPLGLRVVNNILHNQAKKEHELKRQAIRQANLHSETVNAQILTSTQTKDLEAPNKPSDFFNPSKQDDIFEKSYLLLHQEVRSLRKMKQHIESEKLKITADINMLKEQLS